MRMTWKMSPKETGLRAVAAGPRSHFLKIDGEEMASVGAVGRTGKWFWTAFAGKVPYHNSWKEKKVYDDVDSAKREAEKYVLKHLNVRLV